MEERSAPFLETVHDELDRLAGQRLQDGWPAYLFRGERCAYPDTFSSLDRIYHDHPDIYDELDALTAFAMARHDAGDPPSHMRGAFAQHYGLFTQMFDFTASPNVAINFAANRPHHEKKSRFGWMGVLDVAKARASEVCFLFDLRGFEGAPRAVVQQGFGLIYKAFVEDDVISLKRTDIRQKIGLDWWLFAHYPDDESYLFVIGNDHDLTDHGKDVSAAITQATVDEFTHRRRRPLSTKAARLLAEQIPAVGGRTKEQNAIRWCT